MLNLAALVASTVAGMVLLSAPATAAASECPSFSACLFNGTEFANMTVSVGIDFTASNCAQMSPLHNDQTSAAVNNTDWTLVLYQDYSGGGKYITLAPHTSLNRLDNVLIFNSNGSVFGWNTFNDRTSSYCLL
ncbi:peptidase inhibitor family I36 protein [Streptomyces sp. NPDC001770]